MDMPQSPDHRVPSNGVLLERLEYITANIKEMRDILDRHVQHENDFEKSYIQAHSIVVSDTKQAHIRIDGLVKQVEENARTLQRLEQDIQPLIAANKILTWLAVALGAGVVTLIFAILTHSVQIIMP